MYKSQFQKIDPTGFVLQGHNKYYYKHSNVYITEQ